MLPRLLLCIALAFLGVHQTFSQSSVDSLINVAQTAPADTNKIKLLLKISSQLQGSNVQQSLNYAELALELARKLNNPILLVKSLNTAGHMYDFVNFKEKAIILHQEAIKICEKHDLTREMGDSYNWLGGVYYNRSELGKAQEYWEMALELRVRSGNETGYAGTLNNLGELQRLKGREYTALGYYKRAIAMNTVLRNDLFLSINYTNCGLVQITNKNYEEADTAFQKALIYAEKVNNIEQIALVHNSYGLLFLKWEKYDAAVKSYNKGLKLASQCGSMVERASALEGLAQSNRKLNKSNEAFDYLLQFKAISDTLNNLAKNRQVLDVSIRYDTEKRQRELDQLKTEKSVADLKEKSRLLEIYGLMAGLVLVFFIAGSLFYHNRTRRKLNIQLNERLLEINKSINYAQKIQNTLLANESFIRQNIENHFVFFKSKDIVSGDFYWATSVTAAGGPLQNYLPTGDDKREHELFYMAVCDSTGHGVPGAFMSLLNIGFLAEAINEKRILDTGQIFNYVRQRLISVLGNEGQKDGFDGILMCFDKTAKTITYSAANNCPVIVNGDELTELSYDKMPVGVGERTDHFKTYSLQWQEGGTLYLYTDGYADQFGGAKGKKFMYKQLNELIRKSAPHALDKQKEILENAFNTWRGKLEQVDDICVVGVRL
jgi:serine phosphatase RsbU (regulator of sigma subunit)